MYLFLEDNIMMLKNQILVTWRSYLIVTDIKKTLLGAKFTI